MSDMNRTSIKRYAQISPVHLVALIDIGLFSLLAYQTNVFNMTIFYYGLIKACVTYLNFIFIYKTKIGETYLTTIVSLLCSLGLVMQFRLSISVGSQQFIWFLISNFAFLVVVLIFKKVVPLLKYTWITYLGIVTLFVLTLTFGTKLNGAKNWLSIAGFSFQPSEIIKIAFVIMLASSFAYPESLKLKVGSLNLTARWTLMAMVFSILGFFILQREFGTALVVFMVYITSLYVFERQLLFAVGNLLIAALGGSLAATIVPHIKIRMTTWLSPFSDMGGKGYQITQSLFAIGTGGFFGTGIGLGNPYFIPNVATDFIFSAIAEELGLFGSIALLLLYYLIVYRGIKISMQMKDPYYKVLAFSLTILLAYQTFVIIGGVTRLIPLTGITLPFISYGGTSLLSSFVLLGLLQALSGQLSRKEQLS